MGKIIPYSLKLVIHLIVNRVVDLLNGYAFFYARRRESGTVFQYNLEVSQEIKPNEAKKQNFLVAIKSIESIQINPNEIFSFWKAVGKPSRKNGFAESRSIIKGRIDKSFGGGLCQLSGLIYYISLLANLEIIERHNHSVDIYTNETRFAPLGADATVAYGYKDLKIRNNLKKPIKFSFSIVSDTITIKLNHSDKIETNIVEFEEYNMNGQEIEVVTLLNRQVKDRSIYRKLEPRS